VTPRRPPAFIGHPHGWGIISAVRSLGRAGVPVWVGVDSWYEAGQYSGYVRKRLRAPLATSLGDFARWLDESSDKIDGAALLPFDDSSAWIYSLQQERLGARHPLFQPSAEAQRQLVDKFALGELCRDLGIDTPRSEMVRGGQPPTVGFPLLLKPRTPVGAISLPRGRFVADIGQLEPAVAAYVTGRRDPAVAEFGPEAGGVFAQEFIDIPGSRVYSLAGFADRTNTVIGLRASTKVMQRPVRTGVGVCFEEATVDEVLAAHVQALCRHTGFRGIFEVEFLLSEHAALLIDFNTRFYGEMAFEIARGLDLPAMLYAAAIGDDHELARLAEVGERSAKPTGLAYCDRPRLELALRQGPRSRGPAAREWRRWLARHRGRLVQPAHDRSDPLPGLFAYATRVVPALAKLTARRAWRR
jgi:predicted ATP-grasp superfamily ATP-dependent carboligase